MPVPPTIFTAQPPSKTSIDKCHDLAGEGNVKNNRPSTPSNDSFETLSCVPIAQRDHEEVTLSYQPTRIDPKHKIVESSILATVGQPSSPKAFYVWNQ